MLASHTKLGLREKEREKASKVCRTCSWLRVSLLSQLTRKRFVVVVVVFCFLFLFFFFFLVLLLLVPASKRANSMHSVECEKISISFALVRSRSLACVSLAALFSLSLSLLHSFPFDCNLAHKLLYSCCWCEKRKFLKNSIECSTWQANFLSLTRSLCVCVRMKSS